MDVKKIFLVASVKSVSRAEIPLKWTYPKMHTSQLKQETSSSTASWSHKREIPNSSQKHINMIAFSVGFCFYFLFWKKTSQNCGKKIEKQHKKYSESIEFQITSIHCTVQSTFRYAHLKKQHFDVYSEGGKKRETIFRSATKTSV